MTKAAKIKEAKDILKELGMSSQQQNEMSALTLLALCNITKDDPWKNASSRSVTVTKDIMTFVRKEYGRKYAPNTRETFRRQVLHQLIEAGLVKYNPDSPSLPVNSPKAHYALTQEACNTIRAYGSAMWEQIAEKFRGLGPGITKKYSKARKAEGITLRVHDKTVILSPGKHNRVQVAIATEFMKRFVAGGHLIYLGDTEKKNLFMNEELLTRLRIPITEHSKLPDVIIYDEEREWLFLFEAVTSHGPVTPTRVLQLEKLLSKCNCGNIYVSAFPDRAEFRKHVANIAWETEVWIMEQPDHMIHFNGDKFLGPHHERASG